MILGTSTYGGRRFDFTREDALWLGRMLVGEEGPRTSDATAYERGRVMVSTMVRRWVMAFGSRASVTELVIGTPDGRKVGWSQPIRYRPHLEKYEHIQTMPWDAIPEPYRRAVMDTLTGKVPLAAPTAIDAAARDLVLSKINSGDAAYASWRILTTPARSTVISTALSRSKPEPVIVGASSAAGAALAAAALVAVGLAWKVAA